MVSHYVTIYSTHNTVPYTVMKKISNISSYSREELKEKYEDKISKELSGPTYEVLAKIMKVIINRRVTGPGDFLG